MPRASTTAVDVHANGSTDEYTLYPMRWLALFQFAVLNAGNAAQWVVFGIVVDQSKEFFGLDTVKVNMLSASYEMLFIVLGPFAMNLFDKRGVRSGLRCASFFNFIGCVGRFVAVLWAPNFTMAMISQVLLGVTFIFAYPAPPILAARWFGEKERTLATTIAAVSNSMGVAVGQLIPPLIVTPDNHGRDRWLILFAVGCSYSLIEAFLIAFVIPFGPLTPPSSAEEVKGPGRAAVIAEEEHFSGYASSSDDDVPSPPPAASAPRHNPPSIQSDEKAPLAVALNRTVAHGSSRSSLRSSASSRRRSQVASQVLDKASTWDQVRSCLARPGFRGLFVGMALFFGCQWSCMGLMAQIVKPMGISEATVGWMGFSQICAGSVFAVPFSAWVDRIRVYKAPLTAMLIACTVLYNLFAMTLTFQPDGMVPIAFTCYVLLGIPQACAVPVMFEYAVELTYPVDESLSGIAIVWLANVVAVPMLFIVPAIIGDPARENSALIALYLLVLISFVATLLVGTPEEQLQRLAYEKACRDVAHRGTDNASRAPGTSVDDSAARI
uniref:Major facilitator superfamily (MFS) profile domain-containing protein n=1 Tax=Neobodo designis TaxID=312471 RepID=A0A7S1QAQ5_NEODS